jgi:hypothetical protein
VSAASLLLAEATAWDNGGMVIANDADANTLKNPGEESM